MRLSAKVIKNYANINSFDYGNEWVIRAGEPNTLYFQLVDLDQDGLRYMSGAGVSNQPASVSVNFPSIDDDAVLDIAATLADAADGSIWKISLSDAQVPSSGNVVISVTEGAVTRKFGVLNMISVEHPGNDGSC